MQSRLKYIAELKRRSRFFLLEVDAVSSECIVNLDLRIFRGPRFIRTGLLDFSGYVKPSSIWRPLAPWSCHTDNIHQMWPINEVSRRAARCCSRSDSKAFVQQFIDAFVCQFGFFPTRASSVRRQVASGSVPRLVIPYNFVWRGVSLQRVVGDIPCPFDSGVLQFSWCLGESHLIQRVKMLTLGEPEFVYSIFDGECG